MISYYNKVLLIKRYDPLVKWLRHGPFTAVTWVQIPYGSLPQFNFLALSNGGLPKWLKGTVLKTVRRLCRAWVQIPHPPLVWSIGAVVYLASLSRRRSWVQIPYGPLMAELVKGLTHWFVDPACVGSIPTFRPIMED